MNFQEFKDNFKCPECNTNFVHPRASGHYYCRCNNACLTENDHSISFGIGKNEWEYAYVLNIINISDLNPHNEVTVIYYGKTNSFWLPKIPSWVLDNNLIEHVETLITFK